MTPITFTATCGATVGKSKSEDHFYDGGSFLSHCARAEPGATRSAEEVVYAHEPRLAEALDEGGTCMARPETPGSFLWPYMIG